eukprot:38368_1
MVPIKTRFIRNICFIMESVMVAIGLNYLKLLENDSFRMKHFDASCVSDFVAENELFLIGNALQSLFKFNAMVDVQMAEDYAPYYMYVFEHYSMANNRRLLIFLKVIRINENIPKYISEWVHVFD